MISALVGDGASLPGRGLRCRFCLVQGGALPNPVTETAAAPPALAAGHFSGKLGFGTDWADRPNQAVGGRPGGAGSWHGLAAGGGWLQLTRGRPPLQFSPRPRRRHAKPRPRNRPPPARPRRGALRREARLRNRLRRRARRL